MNTLSWTLYAADIAESISTVLTTVAIGAGIGGVVAVVGTAMKTDIDNIGVCVGEKKQCFVEGWRKGKGFFVVGIAAALIATPIPSKDTVYAIAASEAGDRALNSPTGDKAVRALNAWLDRQIQGPKK